MANLYIFRDIISKMGYDGRQFVSKKNIPIEFGWLNWFSFPLPPCIFNKSYINKHFHISNKRCISYLF